jgi:hypothetical protein
MLKITHDDEDADIVRVNLCGRFTRDYVPEVEKALSLNGSATKRLALDLMNVTFVDRAAMEFLRAAKSRRIKTENLPSYVTRWIQQDATKDSSESKLRKK